MFICHDQEKQVDLLPNLKKKVQTPEGVPRLFDLVKVQEERMKLAFFAALGNTVVAKDLDQVGFHISEAQISVSYQYKITVLLHKGTLCG